MDASHLDDAALSAALDGELDDAAGRHHLAACAGCTARRDQLAAAREALADAPIEPVDELTRRRLIAAAVAEAAPAPAQPRRWYQSPALAGGVAAALLALFAAVPFVTGGRSSTGGTEQGSAAFDMAAGEFLGDLGDLSDPSALRGRLGATSSLLSEQSAKRAGEGAAGAASGGSDAPEAVASSPAPAAARPTAAPPAVPQPSEDAAEPYGLDAATANRDEAVDGLDRTVADACARTLAAGPAQGSTLRALGTGTYQGALAVVAVFQSERGTTTAYIASRDGCRVLTRYDI